MALSTKKQPSAKSTVLLDIVSKTLQIFDADIERLNVAQRKINDLLSSVERSSKRSDKLFTDLRRELNGATRINSQLETNLRNFASLKEQFATEVASVNGSRYQEVSERIERTEAKVKEKIGEFSLKLQTWNVTLRDFENMATSTSSVRVSSANSETYSQDDGKSAADEALFEASEELMVQSNGRIALADEATASQVHDEHQSEIELQRLASDMAGVRELYQNVRNAVEEQSVAMSGIEEHVEVAHENVQQGSLALRAAARAKQAALPLSGMLLGAAVGGPMGLVVGFKVGLLAAASGAGVGYVGGRMIKNRKENATEEPLPEASRISN